MKTPLLLLFFNLLFTFTLTAATYEIASLTTSQLFTLSGASQNDKLGFRVNPAGDINNDGFDDILVGVNSYTDSRGIVYVVYGGPSHQNIDLATQSLDPATTGFTIIGNASGDYLGKVLNKAGDINGDGYDDIIIGLTSKNSNRGIAYVIYGGSTATRSNVDLSTTLDPQTTGFQITGNSNGDYFGSAVGTAGKFNEDQYDDLIIAASSKTSSTGVVYVIYGGSTATRSHIDLSTQALDPLTTGLTIIGPATSTKLGNTVNSAGDVNKDGYNDIILGTSGRGAYVVYGNSKASLSNILLASQPLDPQTTGFSVTGLSTSVGFGNVVNSAGDVNNDGYQDIIIGAYKQGAGELGTVYVIYGGPLSTRQNIDFTSQTLDPQSTGFLITGEAASDHIGYAVSSAGDINNDGYSDILFAADNKDSATGTVYVVYGKPTKSLINIALATQTLDPTSTGFSIVGTAVNDHLGYSLSTAGDFDGDGKADLLIGSYEANNNFGKAYVIFPPQICDIENCQTCSQPSTCKTCSTNFEVQNSICQECPADYFSLGVTCQPCSDGCAQCSSDSICEICKDGYSLLASKSCLSQSYTTASAKASAAASDGASFLGSLLSSGSSLPINFGLVAKLLKNLRYLDVTVSNELEIAFFGWKTTSSLLAAPKSWSQKSHSKPLPFVFSQYGLETVFLINYWRFFIMAMIGLAIFVVFKSAEALSKSPKPSRWYLTWKIANITASNFALTQFYSSFDDLVFFFVLDAKSTEFDTSFRILSFAMGIILLVVGVLILILHLTTLYQYQRLKRLQDQIIDSHLFQVFIAKYQNVNLLFRDFNDSSFSQQTFLWIHVSRTLLASLITTLLFQYPLVQTSLLTSLSIGIILFLVVKRPFKDPFNASGQFFCEILLLIANTSMLIMASFDEREVSPSNFIEKFSKMIIIIYSVLLIGGLVFMALGTIKAIYMVVKGDKKPTNMARKVENIPQPSLQKIQQEGGPSYKAKKTMATSIQCSNPKLMIRIPAQRAPNSQGMQRIDLFSNSRRESGPNYANSKPWMTDRKKSNEMQNSFQQTSFDDSMMNTSNANLITKAESPVFDHQQQKKRKILKPNRENRGKIHMPEGYQRSNENSPYLGSIVIPEENHHQGQQGEFRVTINNSARVVSTRVSVKECEEFLRLRSLKEGVWKG